MVHVTMCTRYSVTSVADHGWLIKTTRHVHGTGTQIMSGLKVITDRDLYVASATPNGYLDVDGAE